MWRWSSAGGRPSRWVYLSFSWVHIVTELLTMVQRNEFLCVCVCVCVCVCGPFLKSSLNLLWHCLCSVFWSLGPRHVGSYFPDQGSDPHPLHWKAKSQPLDLQESPRIWVLEWLLRAKIFPPAYYGHGISVSFQICRFSWPYPCSEWWSLSDHFLISCNPVGLSCLWNMRCVAGWPGSLFLCFLPFPLALILSFFSRTNGGKRRLKWNNPACSLVVWWSKGTGLLWTIRLMFCHICRLPFICLGKWSCSAKRGPKSIHFYFVPSSACLVLGISEQKLFPFKNICIHLK